MERPTQERDPHADPARTPRYLHPDAIALLLSAIGVAALYFDFGVAALYFDLGLALAAALALLGLAALAATRRQ